MVSTTIWSSPLPYKSLSRGIQARSYSSDSQNELHGMSAKQLKAELKNLGIRFDDCFEKNELVDRLAKTFVESKTPLVSVPLQIFRSSNYAFSVKEDVEISLNIGGKGPFQFLIDTGSSSTMIRPEIGWKELQIPRSLATKSVGIGAASDFEDAYSVPLPDVKIQNYLCKPFMAIVMDLSNRIHPSAAGIVGINMLSQYDVEFDFVAQKLSFFDAGAAKRNLALTRGMSELAIVSGPFGVPYVKVQVGSSSLQPAILDLGCSLCVVSTAVARASGLDEASLVSFFKFLGRGPILGGFGIGGATLPFTTAKLDISIPTVENGLQFETKNATFAVGDMPAMNVMGAEIILGLEILRQSKLIISMSTSSLFLKMR